MCPELSDILREARPGTKFRFANDLETTFTVVETEVKRIKRVHSPRNLFERLLGVRTIIGYHLQKESPRIRDPYYGNVWIGAGGSYEPEDVEIIESPA